MLSDGTGTSAVTETEMSNVKVPTLLVACMKRNAVAELDIRQDADSISDQLLNLETLAQQSGAATRCWPASRRSRSARVPKRVPSLESTCVTSRWLRGRRALSR